MRLNDIKVMLLKGAKGDKPSDRELYDQINNFITDHRETVIPDAYVREGDNSGCTRYYSEVATG